MNHNEAPLTLHVVDCRGQNSIISCDAVRLCVKDSAQGKGGGWLGIRKGHMPALIVLENASVKAFLADEEIYTHPTRRGSLASVRDDKITLFL